MSLPFTEVCSLFAGLWQSFQWSTLILTRCFSCCSIFQFLSREIRSPKCQCPSRLEVAGRTNWEWPLPLLPLPFHLLTSRHPPFHSTLSVFSVEPILIVEAKHWSGWYQLTGSAPVLWLCLWRPAAPTNPTPLPYNWLHSHIWRDNCKCPIVGAEDLSDAL